ncbi:MAG: DUF3078 domain-containing protein [Candidatus Electryonea clarkiae]|nr:DUF3078 domain-containing protein [Candidatus Electryonea clarkiae]MDP8289181.1 DUF3078 domain-containing protein [Candidatus Electryonea clarkiae]
MKSHQLFFLSFLIPFVSFSQENKNPEGWQVSADANLSNTQSVYSDSWDGNESGSIAWTSALNGVAEKQLSKVMNSRNTLKLEYGQIQTQDRTENIWSGPQKSSDNIDFESLFRLTFDSWADPYISGRFQSLFTDERNDPLEFVNPMTLTESAGISRTILKNEKQELISRIGLGIRQRMDRFHLSDPATGATESKTISDAGVEWISELKTPILSDRIHVITKLLVFQALHNSETKDLEGLPNENYWQTTDFDLETIFTANITQLIMVNLNMRWLYDKEIDLRGRFKEVLSLGLTFKIL